MEKFRIVIYYHMYSNRVDGIPNLWFEENFKGIGHFRDPKTHFRNEANCKTFLEKMSFICMKITNTFLCQWLRTQPRFETEAWGNPEMTHLNNLHQQQTGKILLLRMSSVTLRKVTKKMKKQWIKTYQFHLLQFMVIS